MAKQLSNLDAFIREIRKDLKAHGVRLIMRKSYCLDCGAVGFFSEDDAGPVIEIAKLHPQWKLTLIHEYNHFCQYKEGTRLAKQWNADKIELFAVEDWLDGARQPSTRELKICLALTIKMEHDCEMRTLRDFAERNLLSKKDIRKYIKEANSTLVNYAIMRAGILKKLRYKKDYFGAPLQVYRKMSSKGLYSLKDLLNAEYSFCGMMKHYKRLTVE